MQLRKKLGYATGDLGISISYFAVGFFFLYYLTDIVRLDPFLAGVAFFYRQTLGWGERSGHGDHLRSHPFPFWP